jgi:hypothetical protein
MNLSFQAWSNVSKISKYEADVKHSSVSFTSRSMGYIEPAYVVN